MLTLDETSGNGYGITRKFLVPNFVAKPVDLNKVFSAGRNNFKTARIAADVI